MFQYPVISNGINHSYGFFAPDCSTLHPLGEVVLHNNDIIIAKGIHKVLWDPLIEGPICKLLQLTKSMNSWFALAAYGATLAPSLCYFLHAGPVEPVLYKSLCMDYSLVGYQLMVMACLEIRVKIIWGTTIATHWENPDSYGGSVGHCPVS